MTIKRTITVEINAISILIGYPGYQRIFFHLKDGNYMAKLQLREAKYQEEKKRGLQESLNWCIRRPAIIVPSEGNRAVDKNNGTPQ